MVENLRAPTGIKLYGRMMEDLSVTPVKAPPAGLGDNKFLAHQLTKEGGKPGLARIYGFSYEGQYYDLPKPAIFLVHNEGTRAGPAPPEFPDPDKKKPDPDKKKKDNDDFRKGAVSPGTVDESGVPRKDWNFADDICYWEYDKGDFSIRLDISTGPLEQILLETELRTEAMQLHYSGKKARMRPPRGGGGLD
jgi:hypothetical protein